MTAHQMLAKVRNLPPLSRAAVELGRVMARSDANNSDVVSVIREDAVLTAKLLKACNSPTFGFREPVSSIDQAVLLLGHSLITQVVAAIAFQGVLTVPLAAHALYADGLWRHSLRAAAAAQAVASRGEYAHIESSVAFTAGLLHDIGKLITNEFFSREAMVQMRQLHVEGMPLVDAERQVLGADHTETGAALAHVWRLPEALVEAIALHHQPVVHPQVGLSALAAVGSALAHLASHGENSVTASQISEPLLATFDLGPIEVDQILTEIAEPAARLESSVAMVT